MEGRRKGGRQIRLSIFHVRVELGFRAQKSAVVRLRLSCIASRYNVREEIAPIPVIPPSFSPCSLSPCLTLLPPHCLLACPLACLPAFFAHCKPNQLTGNLELVEDIAEEASEARR
jgi:hypothetical protein